VRGVRGIVVPLAGTPSSPAHLLACRVAAFTATGLVVSLLMSFTVACVHATRKHACRSVTRVPTSCPQSTGFKRNPRASTGAKNCGSRHSRPATKGPEENHDFFSGSGSSYVIGKAEATEDDDWDF